MHTFKFKIEPLGHRFEVAWVKIENTVSVYALAYMYKNVYYFIHSYWFPS